MLQRIRLARDIQTDSVVDGPGLRFVIWLQGCIYACPGCHNPHTWDLEGGTPTMVRTILRKLPALMYHDGLTLSGGEPLLQAEGLLPIAQYVKSQGLNIWCYSGATFEELLKENNPHKMAMLQYIDVLVDGRFVLALRSMDTPYRGSSNQCLVDVQASLKAGKKILWELE